jgi:hypothetical protein
LVPRQKRGIFDKIKAGATFKPEEYSSISKIALTLHSVLNFVPNEVYRPKLLRRLKIGPISLRSTSYARQEDFFEIASSLFTALNQE